jgi:hypothetical protein
MKSLTSSTILAFGFCATVGLDACSDKASVNQNSNDGGGLDSSPPTEAGTVFTPPADPGPGGVLISISGEAEAAEGYPWSSAGKAAENTFVDGWAVTYEHLITTVGNITINADPDTESSKPERVGAVVAKVPGLFAVDLTLGGSLAGKSGEPADRAIAIAAVSKAQANLDPTARYAFSYDTLVASGSAQVVNLDTAGKLLYAEAVASGDSMIVTGTAVYRGPTAAAGSVFAKMPARVKFKFSLKNPSTYANCANDDLAQVGGEYPRGIQTKAAASITAQISWHTDHMFWDRLNVEGTPLHFDAIAAQASTYGDATSEGIVSSNDLVSIDVTGFKTKSGDALPWRSLVADYAAPAGQMRFDLNGTSLTPVNSYRGYLAYSAASGGHLNRAGECAIRYNFTP